MRKSLEQLAKEIADYLGIDVYPIKFEDLDDDSRLYIKEEYVAINKKFKDDYVECSKCIAHEYRNIFQLFYVELFDDAKAKLWKQELSRAVNSSNIADDGSNYYLQDIEMDAFAFAKMYLEKFEGMKIPGLDEVLGRNKIKF